MEKLNYYDKDDEDIKDEIKDILKEELYSLQKFDKLIKLISDAPLDQNVYAKLLLIFRQSIFSRAKYSKKLEAVYQKGVFMRVMAYHIAILKHKKLNYKAQYEKYRDDSKPASIPYAGYPTLTDIDGNVMKLVEGSVGTEISSKKATQDAAAQDSGTLLSFSLSLTFSHPDRSPSVQYR